MNEQVQDRFVTALFKEFDSVDDLTLLDAERIYFPNQYPVEYYPECLNWETLRGLVSKGSEKKYFDITIDTKKISPKYIAKKILSEVKTVMGISLEE